MKAIYRCEYCDKMGVAEFIQEHEETCIHNITKRSCNTCKSADFVACRYYKCKAGKEIPEGQFYQNCDLYEWDGKDHTTRNPVAFNNLFGGLFG